MDGWRGARILLTGASDGIGAEMAAQWGAAGARVALFARRRDRLEAVADRVRSAGGEALVHPGDVTRQADLDAAVRALHDAWGGVDVVVANAGVSDYAPVDAIDIERWARVIDVNATGAIRTIRAALPSLLAQGSGHVVGVASISSFRGLPGGGAYAASKAALTRFLESIRPECRARGVRVTTVHPGYVRTAMTEGHRGSTPWKMDPDEAARRILRAAARGRREVVFPLPMAALVHVLRALPNALFDRLAGRRAVPDSRRERRAGPGEPGRAGPGEPGGAGPGEPGGAGRGEPGVDRRERADGPR